MMESPIKSAAGNRRPGDELEDFELGRARFPIDAREVRKRWRASQC